MSANRTEIEIFQTCGTVVSTEMKHTYIEFRTR
jgi:hypothetical protein